MIDLSQIIPGYESVEIQQPKYLEDRIEWTPDQWQADFVRSRNFIVDFLQARDPYIILSRSAARLIIESGRPHDLQTGVESIEQAHVELLQAVLLMNENRTRSIPTSPRNFVRLWDAVQQNFYGFMRRSTSVGGHTSVENYISWQIKSQTLQYRNIFFKDDCEETMREILEKIERKLPSVLGFSVLSLFQACIKISEIIVKQLNEYGDKIRAVLSAKNKIQMLKAIQSICESSPVAALIWRVHGARFEELETLRYIGLQLSDLGYVQAFTLSKQLLDDTFSPEITYAIYELSIAPGDIKGVNPDHIYLNNPIWQRPYVKLANGDVFAPIPQLIYSFPFSIMEYTISKNSEFNGTYKSIRSEYLELKTVELLEKAVPSAKVYRGIAWNDPDDGKIWENDVLAVVGNFLFIFEAKSGGIKAASRRGGILSLRKNLSELFIDPGQQAGRLQRYLYEYGNKSKVYVRSTGEVLDLEMDRPKVVFSFSICIEHFAAVTSAKSYLREIGLVSENTYWSPVISLGELYMIVRFLDSEVSLVHYLTRRSTLEQVFDFHADEQDILSAYLNNGLWIDVEALDGRKIIFFNSDEVVRKRKMPRADRTVFELQGVKLPPLWELIVKQIYMNPSQRHRFDIINTILNQYPHQLAELERRIRRYRRGVSHGGDDTAFIKRSIGKITYSVAIHLEPRLIDQGEFHSVGRELNASLLAEGGGVEGAFFLFARKPKVSTFSIASFYRYVTRAAVLEQ